jgi:hypothetical protein
MGAVVVVLQEEKKAIQDAMIAKIVAEAKRKQAEEDEMRMVRGSTHKHVQWQRRLSMSYDMPRLGFGWSDGGLCVL